MTCPPPGYSGLEMLAWQLSVGLAKRGHQVTLVAPRGSVADGVQLHETTLGESEQQAFSGYGQKLKDFDCIIDHSWNKWSYMGRHQGQHKTPILGVCHAPIETMYSAPPPVDKPCLVAISKDQGEAIKERLRVGVEVAYKGVDLDLYRPAKIKRNGRYLFLARFSSIKGPDIAVKVAKDCGIGLDLVGDDTLTQEPELIQAVFRECSISPALRYVGPQMRELCVDWFQHNKALLHPNQRFREPFGLAPVEAQLCGMPVIAWDNGACRETIKHCETGFLVKSMEEMNNLIKTDAVSAINPKRCREWASQFSLDAFVKRYEELCSLAVSKGW